MILQLSLLAAILSLLKNGAFSSLVLEDICGTESVVSNEVNLYINSKRNETEKWKTTFAVHTDSTKEKTSDGMVLDLKQVVIRCGDKELIQVRGILGQETPVVEKMYFIKGGPNAEISKNGRTLTRKTGESDYVKSSAITNRPLRDNEMLEVSIDKVSTKWTGGIMMGVTTLTPDQIQFGGTLLEIKSGTIVHYYESVYSNGGAVQSNYGVKTGALKVGDTMGVMRKDTGLVHFFVNGVDQGPVSPRITGTIYGLVDTHANAMAVTMTKPRY